MVQVPMDVFVSLGAVSCGDFVATVTSWAYDS